MADLSTSKQEILKEFQQLRDLQAKRDAQIKTKAEEAADRENQEIAGCASAYTVQGIVTNLASMQLGLADRLDALADSVVEESDKIEELDLAIDVEASVLKDLKAMRVAAEALAILKRDNDARLEEFEARVTREQEELEKEIAEQRATWTDEDAQFIASAEEQKEQLARERAQAAADHAYERERRLAHEQGDFDQRRRKIERELGEEEALLVKDWTEREAVLAEHADEIEQMRARVEAFPQELAESKDKAREAAIKKTRKEAAFEAELAAKEFENAVEEDKLRVESLEQRIEDQIERIRELVGRLQAADTKTQTLAMKALEHSRAVTNSRAAGE